MNLIIIGPSGGGKGTQAKKIAEKFGIRHISMGEVIREKIARGTVYGQKAARYVNRGQWVPTKLVLKMLLSVLKKLDYQNFIIDGFPRLPDQPGILDGLLSDQGKKIDLVINLKIDDRIIMARRDKAKKMGKSFYDQKRNDETEEVITARLKSYHDNIKPILAYYIKKGILVETDGGRSIEEIFRDIVKLIKEKVLV